MILINYALTSLSQSYVRIAFKRERRNSINPVFLISFQLYMSNVINVYSKLLYTLHIIVFINMS